MFKSGFAYREQVRSNINAEGNLAPSGQMQMVD